MAHGKHLNTVLYIVSGRPGGRLGRKMNLSDLRPHFRKVVVVCPGKATNTDQALRARPWPNPLGILDYIGLKPLKRWLDRYLLFPDRSILFVHAIKRKLCRAVTRDTRAGHDVCVLITTPPHATSMVSEYLRRFCPRVRIVIDWQDLWTFDDAYLLRVPPAHWNRLRDIEQRIMSIADINLTTNHKAADVLTEKYRVSPANVAYINHHYDRARQPDGLEPELPNPNRVVRVGFLGTMFKPPKVPGAAVVNALDDVADSGISLEFHLFGDPTAAARQARAGMRNSIMTIHERTDHARAMRNIAQCHLLLIVLADLPNCEVIMHSKLPHYLSLNRPIIALVPATSFVAEVIRNTGAGIVIPTGLDWSAELSRFLSQFIHGDYHCARDEAAIDAFSWQQISRMWIELTRGNANPSM